ncbi:hypothetical protein [Methanobrevibacter gottschalkii]|uniref:hypothetical protein n=1 Tax=Methanobrevibacter gottschalkii TaxID=190974 RepID=UPI0038D0F26A
MNETAYEFLSNIVFSNVDKWIIFAILLIIVLIGFFIARDSTIAFIKSLFNKFFISITILFVLYIGLVLYFLSYTPFYVIFRFSDIIGLIIFDFFLCLFESFKLSYDDEYIFRIINKLLVSLIFVYVLDICRMIEFLRQIDMIRLLYAISSDIVLIIILGIIIFPFMYLVSDMNEYYQINSLIKIKDLKIDMKSVFVECRFNLKKLFKYKKKIETIENENIYSIDLNLFKLENNNIYKLDKEVGSYVICKNFSCFNQNISNCKTKYKKFQYIINYDEGEGDELNYVYVPLDNFVVKLCLKSKTCPLNYQSDLVEFIHEKLNNFSVKDF